MSDFPDWPPEMTTMLDAAIRKVNVVQKTLDENEDDTTYELVTKGLAHLIAGRLMLTGEAPVMDEPQESVS